MYFIIKNDSIIAFTEQIESVNHLKDCVIIEDKLISYEQAKKYGVSLVNGKIILGDKEILCNSLELGKQEPDLEILQKRILQLEIAEVNRKSIEIEHQLLGGI